MAPDPDDELQRTRRLFLLSLLLGLGVLSYLVFQPFLSYAFMGALIVYLAYPLHRRLVRIVRWEPLSALVVLLLVIVLLIAPLAWISVEVVTTAVESVQDTSPDELANRIEDTLTWAYGLVGMEPPQDLSAQRLVDLALPPLQQFVQENAPRILAAASSFFIGLIVMAFVVYYGLVDGPRLVDYLVELSPLDDADDRKLVDEVRQIVDAVFLGHIIVSAIQGILGGIGFLIFGVPNAIFWGFVMIILSLIPLLGAFLVWGPAALYLLTTGDLTSGAGLAAWGVLVVSTVDNFLRPKIVGSRADIHPLLVLVGVLGGLTVFGFIGFVLGPLVLSILIALLNFWRDHLQPRYARTSTPEPVPEPAPSGATPATGDAIDPAPSGDASEPGPAETSPHHPHQDSAEGENNR